MPWHMSISALARGADGSTNTNVYLTAVRNNNTVVTLSRAHTHTHDEPNEVCKLKSESKSQFIFQKNDINLNGWGLTGSADLFSFAHTLHNG